MTRPQTSIGALPLLVLLLTGCGGMKRALAVAIDLAQGVAAQFNEPGTQVAVGHGTITVRLTDSPRKSASEEEETRYARTIATYVAAHLPPPISDSTVTVIFGTAKRDGAVTLTTWGAPHSWSVAQLRVDAVPFYPIAFACPRGDTVRVRFTADSAYVVIPREPDPLALPHVISGSGARYSNGKVTFWNKGDSAFVMRGDSVVIRDCGVVGE